MAAVGGGPSLLPTHHDEFRSKEYWERFFLERNGVQFEWYGAYSDLKANIKRRAASALVRGPATRMLVIGCGNSELSADLYDDGYPAITNLDFSPLVIEEMRVKHAAARPQMAWAVGDMTAMPEHLDGTFDVVVDKGALDALMSEDTADVHRKVPPSPSLHSQPACGISTTLAAGLPLTAPRNLTHCPLPFASGDGDV